MGRYRVTRRLGSGGFARVYRALDPDLELDVALKILRPELAADPDTVERFRREASMAAKLRHPNVVTVLTVGRLDEAFDGAAPGTPYLVMDLLPDALSDRVANGGSLPSAEVARMGAEVARGLAFAHRHGIVHRDVKPENVLFANDGRAVVTDFGIARALTGAPTGVSRQVVLGTPTYFSPEQAQGLPIDGRSDVYALGVTLFRAATGALPFPGDDWYQVMRQHVEATPPRARSLVPTVTPALDAVIARCLAKRPDDRFATADELAAALEVARAARPSGAQTVAVPAPITVRPRRRLAWAGGAGLTLAVTAVAAAALRDDGSRGSARGAAAAPGDSGAAAALAASGTAAAPNGRPVGADSAAGRPPSTLPGAADSATNVAARALDSARRRGALDSARLARAAAPALVINAPPTAEVFVDGVRVARGPVRRDLARPGRRVVRAVVSALPGCPSADTSAAVTLSPGTRQQLDLNPVPCGGLDFNVTPAAARYRLVPERGGAPREGVLPLPQPLFLPDGKYALTLDAAQCAVFTDTVTVVARATVTQRATLLCN